MKKLLFFFTFMFFCFSVAFGQSLSDNEKAKAALQKKLIEEYHKECANKLNYYTPEWQECLDAMIAKDSTVAYFWQQKGMPYFKKQQYEIGLRYLDKAVELDPDSWQGYRAYLKCVFVKDHHGAIEDFEACKKRHANGYEMDHSYDFYIALSYLQLAEYKKAENLFRQELEEMAKSSGENFLHHLDIFYYGIALYEQKEWQLAIEQFDRALKKYPEFSDAKYYKSFALKRLGKEEEARKLYLEAKKDFEEGYTINEDNVIYEIYPYQVTSRRYVF